MQKHANTARSSQFVAVKKADTGLYVHIPFCRSKCGYCDFHSGPMLDLADAYLESLANEARHRVTQSVSTLYIGGGTPSSLSCRQLEKLFDILPEPVGAGECTIEVNPEDVNDQMAHFIAHSTPVNRVSMGVQSMVEAELSAAGRRHSPLTVVRACDTFRRHGITNLSLDLIYGLPTQTVESWRYSLDALLALSPDHLSAYMLSYEPRTRFTAMRDAGKLKEASEETLVEMYHSLLDRTRAAGMEHYEISNFALTGRRAIHNSSYWNGSDYIGLGTGAHSFIQGVRGYNPPGIRAYIRQKGLQFYVEESETDCNRFNDVVITRLRTSDGLSVDHLRRQFGDSMTDQLLRDARPHLDAGRISLSAGVMRIPEESWLVSDAILVDLIA